MVNFAASELIFCVHPKMLEPRYGFQTEHDSKFYAAEPEIANFEKWNINGMQMMNMLAPPASMAQTPEESI